MGGPLLTMGAMTHASISLRVAIMQHCCAISRGAVFLPSDAQDLTQDVFVRLSKHHALDGVASVEGYLFAIAANVAIDFARHHQGPQSLPATDFYEAVQLTSDFSPERLLEGRQELVRIVAALNEMPERMRNIFILARWEIRPARKSRSGWASRKVWSSSRSRWRRRACRAQEAVVMNDEVRCVDRGRPKAVSEAAAAWALRQEAAPLSEVEERRFVARRWVKIPATARPMRMRSRRGWTRWPGMLASPHIMALRGAALAAGGKSGIARVGNMDCGAGAGGAASIAVVVISTATPITSSAESPRIGKATRVAEEAGDPARSIYRTSIGQRSAIELPDGSVATAGYRWPDPGSLWAHRTRAFTC